jgi:hypothetical protein
LGSEELDREFDLEIDRAVVKNEIPMTFEETILMIVKEEGLEQGLAKGHLERNTTVVRNLLRETKFTQREIARLVGVPAAFVREVKRKG